MQKNPAAPQRRVPRLARATCAACGERAVGAALAVENCVVHLSVFASWSVNSIVPTGDTVNFKAAYLFVSLAATLSACGGGKGSGATPTSPAPAAPAAQQNRPPVIGAMNFAPAFGIAQLTRFSFNASASDPDGDAISYAWDVAGNPFTGTNDSITFSGGGSGTARVTVTDSKGATATDTRTFVVGSMTGAWTGSIPGYTNLTFSLTQANTVVTGTFFEQDFGAGKIDPAAPGSIDGDGNVQMRFKLAVFSDFTFRGRMDSSGRRITGGVFGSGFNGESFTMTKQ